MTRYQRKNPTSSQEGFSLIELLVSVALFIVVTTASVGTLLALVNANQKAQSLKSVINNLNFALESMSRTIRTGRFYYCVDESNIPSTLPFSTQDCPGGETGLVLTDDQNRRMAYRVTAGRIDRSMDDGSSWIALTAPEVVIDEMTFHVTGTPSVSVGDRTQPTVTISIRGHAGPKAATDSFFNVQTTVTQRLIDE